MESGHKNVMHNIYYGRRLQVEERNQLLHYKII